MPTSAHTVQRDHLLAAVRDASVAIAAGVDAEAWASTTAPRVFARDHGGFCQGLHRGRLPAIELFETSDAWGRSTVAGGTITTSWTMRCHVPEISADAADSRGRAIALGALIMIRADPYMKDGNDQFGKLISGPLGFAFEITVGLIHVFDRATYETG